MYEKGDKFYYYGDDESLHGREGFVVRKMDNPGTKEYHCKINGFRHSKYLPKWKMRKIPKTPDWEV